MSDEDKHDVRRMRIEPLEATNYFVWSNDMEIMLRDKGLWGCVSVTSKIGTDETAERTAEWTDDLTFVYFMMYINPSCKSLVITTRNPRKMWEKLRKRYQAVSEASIDVKLTSLQVKIMNQAENAIQFTNRIEILVNELAFAVPVISALEKKRTLLKGVRKDFMVPVQVMASTCLEYTKAVAQLVIFESLLEDSSND